jgi:hypothetical protein
MHLEISQEPLYTKIYSKIARAQSDHPDQAPAFTPTERTPQGGHTVWGIFVTQKEKQVCEKKQRYSPK